MKRDKLEGTIFIIGCGSLFVAFSIGAFLLYRWFNWEFSYKAQVQELIKKHEETHHAD